MKVSPASALNSMGDLKLPIANSHTLANGFKLIQVQDNSNPILCLQLYVKTGSVHENAKQRGYSHFIEHLAFKATKDFPQNRLSRHTASLGGMLNAFTDYDATCYYLLLPSEHLEAGLHILSQLALHSTFSPADVELEKDIILEEIKQYQNDPEPDHLEWIQTTFFQKSPLKYPVLGTAASISAASYKDLISFYKTHYNPQNAFLVVCGMFQTEHLCRLTEGFFSSWPMGGAVHISNQPSEPEIISFKRKFRMREKSEDMLSFTLPELCEQHELSDALLIAMRYFAIGKSSRLFKRLVEEEALCSSVKVSSLCGVLSGASVIHTTPLSCKHIPRIIEIFAHEFKALLSNGLPPDELHLVKQDIIHSWLYSFEGMENLANLVAVEEFVGNLQRLQLYGEKLKALTIDDVRQVMRQYWHPGSVSVYHEGSVALPGFHKCAQQLKTLKAEHFNSQIPVAEYSPFVQISLPEATASQAQLALISENYYLIRLSNDMQILFRRLPEKSVTGFSLSTHISQLCETEGQQGLNYFTSSLLLYATQYHNHQDLMHFGREHGFNLRVIHHLDSTSLRGKCHTNSLDKALSTLAEIMRFPSFDRGYFRMLKDAALDGVRRDNDYPVSYAYQKWFKMLVGTHSNMYRSTGNAEAIHALRLKDLSSWYQQWNLPRDFCLAIVGNHEPDYIANLCESLFGQAYPDTEQLRHSPLYESSACHFRKKYHATDQAIVHLGGFATPAANRSENAAFYLLAQILGGDISSRFFDILREKHGLAYQTGFDFSSVHQLGLWSAYAFCDASAYKKCIALMQSIIADIAAYGVSESELTNAKRYLIGMNRFDLESVSYSASSISNLAALGYEPEYYLQREQRIEAVSANLTKQIAQKWLAPEDQYLHILV